jgi:hypothetical protein
MDDLGDPAGGDGAQYKMTVHLAPLIAPRGPAKLMLAVVQTLAAIPVIAIHPLAATPIRVIGPTLVMMLLEAGLVCAAPGAPLLLMSLIGAPIEALLGAGEACAGGQQGDSGGEENQAFHGNRPISYRILLN